MDALSLLRNLTTVFETMAANRTQTVVLNLGGVPGDCDKGLSVWSTNASVQFAGPVLLAPIAAADTDVSSNRDRCSFRMDLPPASIVTATTATTGSKLAGTVPTIPASEPFLARNFSTQFDERSPGGPPLYFSDQGGSFALARDDKNESNQVSPRKWMRAIASQQL